mmetsp:Transcript_51801/g.110818  ORF Transcript_51801/g.110818 Transcript_51801/m.110818 type:complete len:375 (+) Transcript_51801:65-1189(+)
MSSPGRRSVLASLLLCQCPLDAIGAALLVDRGSMIGLRSHVAVPSRTDALGAQSRSSNRVPTDASHGSWGAGGCAAAAGLTAAVAVVAGRHPRRSIPARPLSVQMQGAASPSAEAPPVVLQVEGVEARSVDEARKQILKGLNLTIREGEVHAIMGPNGSGKSTLSKVLIGDGSYEVTSGKATFNEQSLFDLEPHERSLAGLFLAFQSPPAVSGVSNLDFLRAAYNAQRRARQEEELDVIEFYGHVSEKLEKLKISADFLNRNVNEGFSGGERKRNEMLQLSVLGPRLAILDEIDSGLDVDALKDVADAIAQTRSMDMKRSLLVVTHFERFLKYVDADFVHVMHRGRIIKSGGRELAHKLDEEGYDWILKETNEV